MSIKNADLAICILYLLFAWVSGHGFLREPPGRSSMWLFGFNTIPNYQHMELFCGGFPTQWWINDGKCGVCGDPYNAARENEPPNGKYATGIITRNYKSGEDMDAIVQITASHKGYFEFRLCPNNNPNVTVTQDCLNQNLLQHPQTGGTKFFVDDSSVGIYNIKLRIPDTIECEACVLQWRYRTGNRWGCYNNQYTEGPCGLGLGPQEEFYACSDIRITGSKKTTTEKTLDTTVITTSDPVTTKSPTSVSITTKSTTNILLSTIYSTPKSSTTKTSISSTLSSTTTPTSTTTQTTTFHTSKLTTTKALPTSSTANPTSSQTSGTTTPKFPTVKTVCKAVGPWKGLAALDNWCKINCARNYCPPSHCQCGPEDRLSVDNGIMDTGKTCVSLRPNTGWDIWCQHNCPLGLCYPSMCTCGQISELQMTVNNVKHN